MFTLAHRIVAVTAIVATGLMTQSAWAAGVTNGDFENTTGWGATGSTDFPANFVSIFASDNPAAQQSGGNQIAGTTSAYFPASSTQDDGNAMAQTVSITDAEWVFSVDFAATDPGDGTTRTVDLAMTFGGGGNLYFRVNGDGDLQFHDSAGSGWTTPAGLAGAVTFDADVTTTPLVHHMEITMHLNATAALSNYDVVLGAFSATGVNYFNTAFPDDSIGVVDISIFSSATGGFVIDNLSYDPIALATVPEPTTCLLAIVGGMSLLTARRRGHVAR